MKMEKRILDRVSLYYYLRVLNIKTDEVVGHMVDLNMKGLRTLGKSIASVGDSYALRMEFPEPIMGESSIDFECECRRSTDSAHPNFIENGYLIKDMDASKQELLEKLVERFLMSKS
jgi:hypothetical protein